MTTRIFLSNTGKHDMITGDSLTVECAAGGRAAGVRLSVPRQKQTFNTRLKYSIMNL